MDGNFWGELLDVLLRSLVSIIVLFILAKLMGKRQLAQLTFFDYVIGISIGSIAAAFAIDREIDYEHGLAGMVIYALFAILLSIITYKSVKASELIIGSPAILIQNGRLMEENLRKSKIHINDVLEECRVKGAFNIDDIEYAILETSGEISVLLKSQKLPLTPEDLKIPTQYKGLCANLIIDGKVMKEHLTLINLDEEWLKKELKKNKISDAKDVLLASLDSQGKLTIIRKNSDPISHKVLE